MTMAEQWTHIELENLSEGVTRINLNRPHKRNALSRELIGEMLAALEQVRTDEKVRVVITGGNGPSYCSGLDLYYLRSLHEQPPGDWGYDHPPMTLFEAIRNFPKVTIAQVHGYCLGGGLALMNSHDLIIAARNAQIGMPEILRGSFGQMATSTLFHSGIPLKKATLIQLTGRNLSGEEAERLGLLSMVVDESELEKATLELAEEIATRHPAALASAKIAAQMGRDLTLPQALQLDQLVGARQQLAVDPLSRVEEYLRSQTGGTNTRYRRSDLK